MDADDNSNEFTAAAAENEYEYLEEKAVDHVFIKHPIMFETYSICKMAKASTLSKFSKAMFEEICPHFEPDVAHINTKKKKLYASNY